MNRIFLCLLLCIIVISCSNKQMQLDNEKLILRDNPSKFDKIIFCTSNCMLECPMSNIIISSDGNVIFKGQGNITKKGLYVGKVSQKFLGLMISKFKRVNFDSLQSKYEKRVTDLQTVSTTFVKNGLIFKTVYDYGRISPDLFKKSYALLENLYQKIPLKKIADPMFIPLFEDITGSRLKHGDMVLDFTQSETFLLMDLLRIGKISMVGFKPLYKLHTYYNVINPMYDIETDGRYYTFIDKGKSVTIDIGFNFYDVNAKMWKWRKATEYD